MREQVGKGEEGACVKRRRVERTVSSLLLLERLSPYEEEWGWEMEDSDMGDGMKSSKF